jgi:periplasmic divalent cation tolerance protein
MKDRLLARATGRQGAVALHPRKGVIQGAAEDRATLHTRTGLLPEIIERTLAEHPYDVPCVVAVPIVGGSSSYLRWIRDETRSPSISHSPAAGPHERAIEA